MHNHVFTTQLFYCVSEQSWEWVYGKSPQFSITADQSFEFGKMVSSNLEEDI